MQFFLAQHGSNIEKKEKKFFWWINETEGRRRNKQVKFKYEQLCIDIFQNEQEQLKFLIKFFKTFKFFLFF